MVVGQPDFNSNSSGTTGLDPVTRRQVWNTIHKAKKGRTVIITTHR